MVVTSSVSGPASPSSGVRVLRGLRVPTRDGTTLHATAWLPAAGTRMRGGAGAVAAPAPAVVELTPYTTDRLHDDGVWFAGEGFCFVGADVRGRGESDGTFVPMAHDGPDGHDLVQWVADQAWCDGRVVLYGGSYSGNNQWSILGEHPPAVAAASPAAAFAATVDLPRGGVPNLYEALWRSCITGRALYFATGGDRALWHAAALQAREDGRPLTDLLVRMGLPLDEPLLRHLEHPDPGPAWADNHVPDDAVAGIGVPVLTISGTHDDCLPGTLHHWQRFEHLARAAAVGRSHLVVGPWDHLGTDTGRPRVGELLFDDAAAVPLRRVRTEWFRHVLGGGPLPPLLTDRVVWFQAGEEVWRGGPSLTSATRGSRALHLVSTEGPHDAFHSGWLLPAPQDGPDWSVTHDPHDLSTLRWELSPRPGGTDPDFPLGAAFSSLMMSQGGNDPTDLTFSTSVEGNGVVYHTRPLTEPLRLTGAPRLRLPVGPRSTAELPDLAVLLHEIRVDGSGIFLSSDVLRPRPDPGGAAADVAAIDVTAMRWAARTLAAGSRIRLTIRDADSALMVTDPAGTDRRPRTLWIRHDRDDPPVLTLPLG